MTKHLVIAKSHGGDLAVCLRGDQVFRAAEVPQERYTQFVSYDDLADESDSYGEFSERERVARLCEEADLLEELIEASGDEAN